MRCVETHGPGAAGGAAHGKNAVQFVLRLCVDRRRRAEVAAGARIGVHQIAIGRYDERGQPAPLDRKSLSPEQLRQLQAEEVRLARYIGEMGMDQALFEAAAQIRHERIRYLSLDEIARFGIDAREFHESRWTVDEGPPGPPAVVKFVVEAKGSREAKQYRTTRIRLTCSRPGEIRVEYAGSSRPRTGRSRSRSPAVAMRSWRRPGASPCPATMTSRSRIALRAFRSPISRRPQRARSSKSPRRRTARCLATRRPDAAVDERAGGRDRHARAAPQAVSCPGGGERRRVMVNQRGAA